MVKTLRNVFRRKFYLFIFLKHIEKFFTKVSNNCKTPRPNQSPKDPPNAARNFAKLNLGKSFICVLTVWEKAMSILK